MTRFVVLDSGPLGLAGKPRGKPDADHCRDWIRALYVKGVVIVVPEIADYEIRRELIRAGAKAGLRRHDLLIGVLEYLPITTAVMRRAAQNWAFVRRAGLPTADKFALDADCILAAQATMVGDVGDGVTIATTNVGHLKRFGLDIHAREWEEITP